MKQKKNRADNSCKSFSPFLNLPIEQSKSTNNHPKSYIIIRKHFGVSNILHSFIANQMKGVPI